MKLFRSFVAFCIAYGLGVHAAETPVGRVYHYNPRVSNQPTPSDPTIVDPQTARLILAQKLGLAHFHSLKDVSRLAIQQLNQFVDKAWRPFAKPSAEDRSHDIIVIVEEIESPADVLPVDLREPLFQIANPPYSAANAELLKDFFTQSESRRRNSEDGQGSYIGWGSFSKSSHEFGNQLPGQHMLQRSKDLTALQIFPVKTNVAASFDAIRKGLAELLSDAKAYKAALTVIIMPPSSRPNSKHNISPYGDYQTSSKSEVAALNRRGLPSNPRSSSQRRKDSDDDDETEPVTGILPLCFSSEKDCNQRTKKCSGRGTCVAKYESSSDRGGSCFSCLCNQTEVRDGLKGKKTTYFGGAACQKKDIVMPFWLLFGTSIFLLGAVSWALGLMYSMGGEELPSVIGAGVSGPKAR
jgi:hypothetical protein